MKLDTRSIVPLVLIAAAVTLSGCGRVVPTGQAAPASKATAVRDGAGGVKRITLKDIEEKRLGIAFAEALALIGFVLKFI